MNVTDNMLAQLMSDAHVIASVGVLAEPQTSGYQLASYQQSQGYKVIPVNPRGDMVLGHPAVSSVASIEGAVDIVNVLGHTQDVSGAADAAIQAGAKVLWLEPGAHDYEAEQRAKEAGLKVVTNKNFEHEHRRLLSAKEQ